MPTRIYTETELMRKKKSELANLVITLQKWIEQIESRPTPVRSDVAFTCAKCHEVNTIYDGDGDVCWKCDTPRRSTS